MALILIAEDEYLLAVMLAGFLEDAGHEVRMAPHGAAALMLLEERRPDLLISDYMMPLMNGVELAEAVRKHAFLGSMPILLVSGAQGHLARSRPDLFTAVLDKPYAAKELLEVVQRLLAEAGPSGSAG